MKVLSNIVVVLLLCVSTAWARPLSVEEEQRVKAYKKLVIEVDETPLAKTIADLEKAKYISTELYIREAMAKTYTDLVFEENVKGLSKKNWLYSMIKLNMAYLQFVGTRNKFKNDVALNMVIRRKLKFNLPEDIDDHPGFVQTVH